MQPPLYPPGPADTSDGGGLSRGAVLGVHARTRNVRRKKEERTERAKSNGENKEPHAFLSRWRTAGKVSTSRKRRKTNSRAFLSASYPTRPSRDQLATDSVRVKFYLPLSAPSTASREARCSPWPSFARSTILVLRLRSSLFQSERGLKNKHRLLNAILQHRTTLIYRT